MISRPLNFISGLFALAVLFAASGAALAQDGKFDINHFNPPTDNYGLITMDSTRIYRPYGFGAALYLHFLNDSLELNQSKPDGTTRTSDLVGPRWKMDISFGAAFCPYYEAGIDLPFIVHQKGAAFDYGQEFSKSAFGDLRFHNKFIGLNREDWPVGLALINTLFFPSGDEGSYFGNKKTGAEFKVVVDSELGDFLVVGNFGYRIRDRVVIYEIYDHTGRKLFTQEIDDELLYAVGGRYETPVEGLFVMSELRGVVLAREPFKQRFNSPLFWDAALRYLGPLGLIFSGGLEVGMIPGYGAGEAGFFMSVGWSYDRPDKDKDRIADEDDLCPDEAEDRDGFEDEDGCPDPDNDKDGILDVDDQCPLDPEDLDDYRDEDGCPDPDNDADGIPDKDDKCPLAAEDFDSDRDEDGCPDYDTDNDGIEDMDDKCPFEAEDMDKFEDEDGCPDPDNDKDGVPDKDDKCPLKAEDMDGFEDDDGCPDPDNDGDGIPDKDDKCPAKPETINGNADDDGCPDKGEVVVMDKGDRIEFKKPIEFDGESSMPSRSSFTLLNQVASVIKAHGPYNKIVIVGHTDSRGDKRAKETLSRSRANWVKAYLINRGIESDKMETAGKGGAEPISSNSSSRGRRKNNRVEFRFVNEAGEKK